MSGTLVAAKVVKRLGSFELNIDKIQIAPNQTTAIVGPTGSGKTTLLRLLAGLVPVDSGSIQWADSEIAPRRPSLITRRRMAFVSQRPHLLKGRVSWNIGYGLRCRGSSSVSEFVHQTMRSLRILDLADRRSHQLSGGQAQMVAIARAIVLKPDILFLDEPTSHLDPSFVATVENALSNLREQHPFTLVWVTHNLHQAKRMSDSIAFLWDGALVEKSATKSFFESPSDPRSTDFIHGRLIY